MNILGTTLFEDLVDQCDALGDNCAGFDSLGYLKSSLKGAAQTLTASLWAKTGGNIIRIRIRIIIIIIISK